MTDIWREALAECDTLEKFNEWALITARERKVEDSQGFVRAVASEAKRRGYTYVGNKETGYYVEYTQEEVAAVDRELDRLAQKKEWGRLTRRMKPTAVRAVIAGWEERPGLPAADAVDDFGNMLILDYRRRKDKQCIYRFHMVPRGAYLRLFEPDAKIALKQLYTIFAGQGEGTIPDYLLA